jgi:hypothetical protein
MRDKIKAEHLGRTACIYVRQSTSGQVIHNRQSQRLQYGLVERAKDLGWSEGLIKVIDSDLGTTASGSVMRPGFQELLSGVCEGNIGLLKERSQAAIQQMARRGELYLGSAPL